MLPELEERGRGRPCRWWLRAPRRRRVSFEGGHTEDAIGRLRVGRASGTSERQGERLRGPPADGGQRELRALWISNLFESSARTRLRVRVASSVSSPEGP